MTVVSTSSDTVSRSLLRAGALAVVAAIVAGVAVFLIATSLLNITVMMPAGITPEPMPMPIFAVIAASAVGAIGGTVVLALLARFTANPVRLFTLIASAFLVFSLLPLLTMPDLDGSTRAVMVALHVAVGLAVIAVLTTQTRSQGA